MTEPKAVSLRAVQAERRVCQELVDCLREKLEQAERGELLAFAYVAEYDDGTPASWRHNLAGSNAYKMIGQLEEQKHHLLEILRRDRLIERT